MEMKGRCPPRAVATAERGDESIGFRGSLREHCDGKLCGAEALRGNGHQNTVSFLRRTQQESAMFRRSSRLPSRPRGRVTPGTAVRIEVSYGQVENAAVSVIAAA